MADEMKAAIKKFEDATSMSLDEKSKIVKQLNDAYAKMVQESSDKNFTINNLRRSVEGYKKKLKFEEQYIEEFLEIMTKNTTTPPTTHVDGSYMKDLKLQIEGKLVP